MTLFVFGIFASDWPQNVDLILKCDILELSKNTGVMHLKMNIQLKSNDKSLKIICPQILI